jgi:alkylation response protein AidB-like acyl-CoA dehydrogenase
MCRPKALEGLELDPLTTLEVLEVLATGDGSAAWCAMVSGGGAFIEAFVPLEGAKEMFSGLEVVAAGVAAPSGRMIEVDGGYRLSGRWAMASNCRHCHWLVAGAILYDGLLPKKNPSGRPLALIAFVPVSDCKILDTWDAGGLSGTGSHDFEVSDVFVPSRRCGRVPFEASVESSLNRFPGMGFLAAQMAAISVGIARAALDEFVRIARLEVVSAAGATALANRGYAQRAYAEAEASWRSSKAYLHQAVAVIWNKIREGAKVSLEDTASLRMASSHVSTTCARAVDIAYTNAGVRALPTKSRIQRCFRDVHAITQHAFVAPPVLEMVGHVLLHAAGDKPLL